MVVCDTRKKKKTAIFGLKTTISFGFSENFLDFLGDSLEILRWTLDKAGVRSILGEGEIRHVSESTSFSSPTGFPEPPPQPPGDLPGASQEGLKHLYFFMKKSAKPGMLQLTRRHPLPLRGSG